MISTGILNENITRDQAIESILIAFSKNQLLYLSSDASERILDIMEDDLSVSDDNTIEIMYKDYV